MRELHVTCNSYPDTDRLEFVPPQDADDCVAVRIVRQYDGDHIYLTRDKAHRLAEWLKAFADSVDEGAEVI